MLISNKVDRIIVLMIVFIFVFKFGLIQILILGFFLFYIIYDVGVEFRYKKTLVFMVMFLLLSGFKNILRYYQDAIKGHIPEVENIIGMFISRADDWLPELWLIFLLFFLIHYYDQKWCRVYFPKKEFFGEACYRILLNDYFH